MKTSSSFSSSSSETKVCSRTITRRTLPIGAFAVLLLAAIGAAAQTTNGLSNKEIQGRQLVEKLLAEQPAENFTNTGVLQIRNAKGTTKGVPLKVETIVTPTNWQNIYSSPNDTNIPHTIFQLTVIHASRSNEYYITFLGSTNWGWWSGNLPEEREPAIVTVLRVPYGLGAMLELPFVGSDFWLCDLGLEFFHWPDQKILKSDTARSRLCKILESTNPNPSAHGYSRVDSWIDNESLGIVQAKAYDAKGKLLKEFYPKDFKKVSGQWQVGSMEIDNVQTRSRSTLKFDLKVK